MEATALRRVYNELGACLARFVIFREKTKATGVAGMSFDIESWQEITRPHLPLFDYFVTRELDVFVWMDRSGEIQELVGWLRSMGNMHRNPDQMPAQHPDQNVLDAFCFAVVSGFKRFCSNKLNRKSLLKAFNRHRDVKAIGFPWA